MRKLVNCEGKAGPVFPPFSLKFFAGKLAGGFARHEFYKCIFTPDLLAETAVFVKVGLAQDGAATSFANAPSFRQAAIRTVIRGSFCVSIATATCAHGLLLFVQYCAVWDPAIQSSA